MRPVGLLSAFLVLAPLGARAEHWVHTRDGSRGQPMCSHKDSVKRGADGPTYHAVKMCQDWSGQLFAVERSQNFRTALVVRIYDYGPNERHRGDRRGFLFGRWAGCLDGLQ